MVTIHPSAADVQEGQSLELSCHAPGSPPPRVTWSRASGPLSSNHQVVTQSKMQKQARPKPRHQVWSLSAVNNEGLARAASFPVACPFLCLPFASVYACLIIRGRSELGVKSGVCCLQVRGNQLRILSAGPEDSGDYICRVQGNTGNPVPHVHQSSVSVSVTSSSSRKSVVHTAHASQDHRGRSVHTDENSSQKKKAQFQAPQSANFFRRICAFRRN